MKNKLEGHTLIKIDGKMYSLKSDDNYLRNIKNFEPGLVAICKRLIHKESLVLDIGANIGCTTILFGNLGKFVYSFEPSPSTFSYLKENVVLAGLKNIQVLNYGLGSSKKKTSLNFSADNRSGAFLSDQQLFKDHVSEHVEIIPLDDWWAELGKPRIDFIKIDVEGFEKEVLLGADLLLESHKPLCLMEVNHWCLNVFQRITVPDYFDFLRSKFPLLLAIEGTQYANLHDADECFYVMYEHILNSKFQNIIGAFSEDQLIEFKAEFTHFKQHKPVSFINKVKIKLFKR